VGPRVPSGVAARTKRGSGAEVEPSRGRVLQGSDRPWAGRADSNDTRLARWAGGPVAAQAYPFATGRHAAK
jgi:hypothetical protein